MEIIEKENEFILHVNFIDAINESQFLELDTTILKFESEGVMGLPNIPVSGDNAFYNHKGQWVKLLGFDHVNGVIRINKEHTNVETTISLINEVAEKLQAEIR